MFIDTLLFTHLSTGEKSSRISYVVSGGKKLPSFNSFYKKKIKVRNKQAALAKRNLIAFIALKGQIRVKVYFLCSQISALLMIQG